ncbi:MAG: DUF1653 domain-containing protein [Erysipelotrichaceae bacterium]|nr:DUF1653 domain-containing protein [Erysipelotrichaceae bacterium]MBQ7888248.1 DUF1653 domain-containing protein [Erysipelotrichaceae bacterium]
MREIVIGGIYRHFKGDYYLVEGLAKDCESTEVVVLYRQLYDKGELWVRTLSDFMKEVDHDKYPEVSQKYRFEQVEVQSCRSK